MEIEKILTLIEFKDGDGRIKFSQLGELTFNIGDTIVIPKNLREAEDPCAQTSVEKQIREGTYKCDGVSRVMSPPLYGSRSKSQLKITYSFHRVDPD